MGTRQEPTADDTHGGLPSAAAIRGIRVGCALWTRGCSARVKGVERVAVDPQAARQDVLTRGCVFSVGPNVLCVIDRLNRRRAPLRRMTDASSYPASRNWATT